MKQQGFIVSLNYAFEGIIHVLRTQKNMRWHFAASALVLLVALLLGFTRLELALLVLLIGLVLMAEVFNTAIETAIDLFTEEVHVQAKVAKDVSAAAVLLVAGTATVVGSLLFMRRMELLSLEVLTTIKTAPIYVTYISLILVFLLTVAIKAWTGQEDHVARGGMPSVHSAISFAIATSIAFLSESALIGILAFMMASLVAQSRIECGIHRPLEVLAGAVWGVIVTLAVFRLAM